MKITFNDQPDGVIPCSKPSYFDLGSPAHLQIYIPQSGRPYFSIPITAPQPKEIFWIMLFAVHPAHAISHFPNTVPVPDALTVKTTIYFSKITCSKKITKSFCDRAGIPVLPKTLHLFIQHDMAVFMKNDISILRIIYIPRTENQFPVIRIVI